MAPRTVLLSGGVGGAKLADGLARILPPERLSVVVNTADDFEHYGLAISPDVDTVLYTLAGLANPATGWGIAGDTDRVMAALRALGDPAWFHLGDRDLATHLVRSAALAGGGRPTEVIGRLAAALGVGPRILPMSDDTVRTVVSTSAGDVDFQTWFVRQRCEPPATGLRLEGAGTARPSPEVLRALDAAEVVVLGPSNPYLSIGPILALAPVAERLAGGRAPVVALSPIIAGAAVKGPAARLLADLAGEASSLAVARRYARFLDGLLVDRADGQLAGPIEALGIAVRRTDALMRDAGDRMRLAAEALALAADLADRPGRSRR